MQNGNESECDGACYTYVRGDVPEIVCGSVHAHLTDFTIISRVQFWVLETLVHTTIHTVHMNEVKLHNGELLLNKGGSDFIFTPTPSQNACFAGHQNIIFEMNGWMNNKRVTIQTQNSILISKISVLHALRNFTGGILAPVGKFYISCRPHTKSAHTKENQCRNMHRNAHLQSVRR